MGNTTIKTWQVQEKPAFRNFSEFIAERLEDGIHRSIAEYLRNKVVKFGSAKLVLPWGTISANVVDGNISPSFEPSKGFIAMLNDDNANNSPDTKGYQDEFDAEYSALFKDYVAWGMFYPSEGNTDNATKCIRMTDEEVEYFLNSYMRVLVTIARDKQRDGKIYRLEIDAMFPYGTYEFDYSDGKISVVFIPHKVFKQYLKCDEIAKRAQGADFSVIKEGTKRVNSYTNDLFSEAAVSAVENEISCSAAMVVSLFDFLSLKKR